MTSTDDKLVYVAYTQAKVIDHLLGELKQQGEFYADAILFPFNLPALNLLESDTSDAAVAAQAETGNNSWEFTDGDPEPNDVRFVATGSGDTYERRADGWQLYVNDVQGERWGVPAKTWAQLLTEATAFGPLYAVKPDTATASAEPAEYSLADAAEVLKAHGIKSGQRRLKARLYAIGWTDGLNLPTREGAPHLVIAEPANPDTGRNAVVRVRDSGVRALIEGYGVTWQR
ncbi:hypothetical protein NONI108955_11195 [Nocardia ninae]|uniref:Uncharacterized protein n=1 Tax=Nocardia ninae NBRC 108245 TaxID=1210091 RepID=A0A511MMU0_9NOCA|nr:hypothetical protein [Nocardia ninae]GEM41935.1 hypothetical protein NN4_64540 [Nocardia ninae NBRC 108245]